MARRLLQKVNTNCCIGRSEAATYTQKKIHIAFEDSREISGNFKKLINGIYTVENGFLFKKKISGICRKIK